jgi:asparagine synthase (glutamine-hydrolysing)
MCGIIGIASVNKINNRTWLSKGSSVISHRGPDDFGEWWSDKFNVGLAHRRLSILDLTNSGHQPMSDVTDSYIIVFNGEIYNFKEIRYILINKGYIFKSETDTEVILNSYREWGEDCVKKINGMFAFAIFDKQNHKLFLARDRAGEKPLFIYYNKQELRFSSELKGLLADSELNRNIDCISLNNYLSFGYNPHDRSMLKGFNKLPPGYSMVFNLLTGDTRMWQYWKLPEYEEPENLITKNSKELVLDLERILELSVKNQLFADVPVGILLSGGVDSSIITALASKIQKNIKTFTAVFPDNIKQDESTHAKLIANHFNTEHHELIIDKPQIDLLNIFAKQFDDPIIDSSMFPTYLVTKKLREYCTVALGGDGGDELFGGYLHHSRLIKMNENLSNKSLFIRKCISNNIPTLLPIGFKGRNWIDSLGNNFDSDLPLIANYFDFETRKKLFSNNDSLIFNSEDLWKDHVVRNVDLLQRTTRTDFKNYLAEDILVKVDRSSMLNSLELRAPFLDVNVIEFAFRNVPSNCKANSSNKKILLKELAVKILPNSFNLNRKQGFSIPLDSWLKKGTFRNYFEEILLDSGCIFNKKLLTKLFKEQDKGYRNGERLFGLVMFELWRNEYGATI